MEIPAVKVFVAEVALQDTIRFATVRIRQQMEQTDKAMLLIEEIPQPGNPFPLYTSNIFAEGNLIKLLLHYKDKEDAAFIFDGIINTQTISVSAGNGVILRVDAEGLQPPIAASAASEVNTQVLAAPALHFTYGINLHSCQLTALPGAAAQSPNRLRGHVVFPGSPHAAINTVIELKGLGERLSGIAYVSGLEQQLSDGGWTTIATLGQFQQ